MLDLIVIILFFISFYKGYRDGIIKSLLTLVAWVAGVAIAAKCTDYVSQYVVVQLGYNARWIPFAVFSGLFILTNTVMYLLINLLEKITEKIKIDTLNHLAGGLLSATLMVILMSTFLFFVNEAGLLTEYRKRHSWTYGHIAPIGPAVIAFVTSHIGDGKDVFNQIKLRYDRIELPTNIKN